MTAPTPMTPNMTSPSLHQMTVAFMVAAGFHEAEFTALQRALVKSQARLKTIASEVGVVNGWQGTATAGSWGHTFPVDQQLGTTLAADLDALVIPAGAAAIGKLKNNLHTRRILTHCLMGGKPVVLFGDAAELLELVDAEALKEGKVLQLTDLADGWVADVLAHLAGTPDMLQAAA